MLYIHIYTFYVCAHVQRIVSLTDEDRERTQHRNSLTPSPPHSASGTHTTFDYLYEFSETRKVLEEFFKPGDNQPCQQPFQVIFCFFHLLHLHLFRAVKR